MVQDSKCWVTVQIFRPPLDHAVLFLIIIVVVKSLNNLKRLLIFRPGGDTFWEELICVDIAVGGVLITSTNIQLQ